jgi:hypothetical protein
MRARPAEAGGPTEASIAHLQRITRPLPIGASRTTIYHVDQGAVTMPNIDARHALKFENEWSREPWPNARAAGKG